MGDATSRRKWWVAIEDLTDASKSVNVQVVRERLKKLGSLRRIVVHTEMGQSEWSEQPAPNGALVVCAVPLERRSTIVAAVGRIIWRETAKAVGGQEISSAGIYNGALLVRSKSTFGQRHRKDLIRADRSIRAVGPIEDIEATLPCFVPETRESSTRALAPPWDALGAAQIRPAWSRHSTRAN